LGVDDEDFEVCEDSSASIKEDDTKNAEDNTPVSKPQNVAEGSERKGKSPPTETSQQDEWGIPHDVFDVSGLTGDPEAPKEALPRVIYDFAMDEAERLGISGTAMALACLVACSGAINDSLKVQPKTHDTGWRESARLWGMMIGDTSVKKSPALKKATDPLKAIEEGLYREWIEANKRYEKQLEDFYESKKRKHAVEREKPEPPPQPRLVVDDITIETISEALKNENANSKVIVSLDELSGFIGSLDCYKPGDSRGKDRAAVLELFNGGPKFIDRIKRGRVYVPNWSACVLGGVQTDVIKGLINKHVVADGFTERFLVAYVKKVSTDGVDRRPNYAAESAYRKVIYRLRSMDNPKVEVFKLCPGAQSVRQAVNEIVDNVMILPSTSPLFRGHLGKLAGIFARMLLLYHLIAHADAGTEPQEYISQETAEKVANLMVDVLLAHSAKFYTEVMPGSTNALHAQWIAGHILSRGLDKISSRDIGRVYHELRYGDKGTRDEEIAKIMGVLENFDWVAPIRRHGERWPTKWRVNPAVHEKFAPHAARERQERADKIRRIRKARLELGLERSEGDKTDDQLS
jgi:hypothetical protein